MNLLIDCHNRSANSRKLLPPLQRWLRTRLRRKNCEHSLRLADTNQLLAEVVSVEQTDEGGW